LNAAVNDSTLSEELFHLGLMFHNFQNQKQGRIFSAYFQDLVR